MAPVTFHIPGDAVAKGRRHKFGAVATTVDGIRFDSKREAAEYARLKLRERAGEIEGLTLQPRFPIIVDGEHVRALPNRLGHRGRPLEYRGDFAFFEGGKRRVLDVKGVDTPDARLKRAIVQHIYKIEIEVIR
jgi:hypothetical protein